MDDSRLTNTTQLQEFLKGSQKAGFSFGGNLEETYAFINHTIDRLHYRKLSWAEKRLVLAFLKKLTGYRHSQLFSLVNRAITGTLARTPYRRIHPHLIYTARDIKLLEKTDELHLRLNGLATKEILRRETEVFGHQEYQTIARVSRAHLYNLRDNPFYKSHWVNGTKPSLVPIGLTQPPENFGRPGSIRVDTVHQRDVYHINAVDEVLQWEIVVCVPTISEQFMLPALLQIIDQFPFVIFNFHSDRGSENINYLVAEFLTKLHIKQTESRSRHPNDNALVETKNGSVIRKNMGWEHLDQGTSDLINRFYQDWFNPYLNYHRPSLFATTVVKDQKGKERNIYDEAMIPYEKLKQVDQRLKTSCLKPGVSFEQLNKIAHQYSDNEFAALMREEERKLFATIQKITNTKLGSRREKED
jgi:transposase InsO family protein